MQVAVPVESHLPVGQLVVGHLVVFPRHALHPQLVKAVQVRLAADLPGDAFGDGKAHSEYERDGQQHCHNYQQNGLAAILFDAVINKNGRGDRSGHIMPPGS